MVQNAEEENDVKLAEPILGNVVRINLNVLNL